jgi:hypothetical protein
VVRALTKPIKYFSLAGTAGSAGGRGVRRLNVYPISQGREHYELLGRIQRQPHSVTPSDVPPLECETEAASADDDMPCIYGAFPHVVSQRTRELLERFCDLSTVWHPVTILCRGRPIDKTYWAVQLLPVLDCLNPERSSFTMMPDGSRYCHFGIVDASKVPSNVAVFCIPNCTQNFVIREDVQQMMKRARMRGCRYEPMWNEPIV